MAGLVPAIHVFFAADIARMASFVIACDEREAFAQGSQRVARNARPMTGSATKQSIYPRLERRIASLRPQ